LRQEGNIVKGKVFSRGNFYYEPNSTDRFSYELIRTIDASQPEKVTLQSEVGDVFIWFEKGKLFVKFLGTPQVYDKV
jgi:hypothetical protein